MNKINIAVLFGGESLENEVSKITGAQIINALNKNKYNIYPIYVDSNFVWWYVKKYPQNMDINNLKKIKINILSGENYFNFNNFSKTKIKIHCAILAVHGGKGENGILSGILDSLKIPHTASDTLSSSLTMNKYLTKLLIKENNLNYLPFEIINKKSFLSFSKSEFENIFKQININSIKNEKNNILITNSQNIDKSKSKNFFENNINKHLNKIKKFVDNINFPLVVKPADQGSSIAVSFVNNAKQLYSALELVFAYSNLAIIEKGIKNIKEYNCSAMKIGKDIKVSEIERPIHKNAILTYADKYGSKFGDKLTFKNSNKLNSKLNQASIISQEKNKNHKKEDLYTSDNISNKGMCYLSREFPAKIPFPLKTKIENLTKIAYEIFDCSGIIRCDFIYYKKRLYLNEINSIPGSLANYLWSTKGYTFSTLLDELIRNTIKNNTSNKY